MIEKHPGSYRDPSGFLFRREGRLLRQINRSFAAAYDTFLESGLYDELVDAELLIPHRTVESSLAASPDAYRVIEPELIPFVSLPREWCPSQLRDAALVTLRIQERALANGMILRDATAHNVQFVGTHAVFIDTLSFEPYTPGQSWIAYRQFCESFLAPLALARRVDSGLLGLQACFPDGIPLEVASRTLPTSTLFRPSLLFHLHLHARSVARYAGTQVRSSRWNRPISKAALQGLNQSLLAAVGNLKWKARSSVWADYTVHDSYETEAQSAKQALVRSVLSAERPRVVWDLGSNTGHFSRLASDMGAYTVSIDSDVEAVEFNFAHGRREANRAVLPLHIDLVNPTPPIGWANSERESLEQRGPADLVVALAVMHHLCLGRNVPIPMLVAWLGKLGSSLLLEFVPKSDPQAERLLQSRDDVFERYTQRGLETALAATYAKVDRFDIPNSQRVLFHCQSPKLPGPAPSRQ